MRKEEYINLVSKQIHYIFDRKSIEEEIKDHLEDSIFDLMEEGLSKEDAESLAVVQMGDPVEVGKMLNKEHYPLLGYFYMISLIVLILILIPMICSAVTLGSNIVQNLTPITCKNAVQEVKLDRELALSTHKVKLDYICEKEDGSYSITFRAWKKYNYSRAGWSSDLFDLKDKNGEFINASGESFYSGIGQRGSKNFNWPEDGILNIVIKIGNILTLDLKEWFDETHEKDD